MNVKSMKKNFTDFLCADNVLCSFGLNNVPKALKKVPFCVYTFTVAYVIY